MSDSIQRAYEQLRGSQLADKGFVDADFARDAARKTRAEMAERRALKVQALIDFVDERIKADRDATAPSLGCAITQLAQAINRGLRRAVYCLTGHDDVADKQALDREDMVLKLGEIIFGNGHRPLQSVETGAEPNQLGEAAHRLSEVRK